MFNEKFPLSEHNFLYSIFRELWTRESCRRNATKKVKIIKKTGLMLHGAQSYDINVFATFSCSPLSSYGSYQKCHAFIVQK